ncbi:membrane protein [Lysinibacillus contaminans]|uniref:Membrane protein n=1 Tax=Lysinibacillus contaminans TaxID=1293441 RepID=A0ABR5JW96_9BACI|nr:AbgT family transporter [Lysinibacillus contaminans]KOS66264.1 membrane protein [Lysinibacillus contaminans]
MEQTKKKKRFLMPDAFIIIFGIIVLSAIATYLVPSGSFERTEIDGRQVVIDGTYATTEANPSSIMDIFIAIHRGMVDSADLIFMVFIVGGVVAIFEHTGAINTGINAMIQKANGRKYPLVITFIVLFACMDMAGLSGNAVIAFIPIGIILAKALKLDPIVGVAMVYLGQYVGVATGTFDPVITGLAQKIAELPLLSGASLRFAAFISLLIVTIIYICLYVRKISKDPSKSLMGITPFGDDADGIDEKAEDYGPFTGRHKLVLLTFAVFIGIFLYGVFNFEWGLGELSAIFLMMGVVAAFIGGIKANDFIQVFIKGAQSIVYGALVIGLARAAVILLENGNVLDTIVNSTFAPLSSFPTIVGAEAIFLFNLLFNLLVTSGSGQAAIVMPFIVPLVDMLDITRQTGVLAFKLGDGITNIITPTSGVLMAVLAVGKIPYLKWVKFIFPVVILWSIVAVILIAIAVLIDYGPF